MALTNQIANACLAGDISKIKQYLQDPTNDINEKNNGAALIHIAFDCKNETAKIEMLRLIISHPKVNVELTFDNSKLVKIDGYSPIHLAARLGSPEVIELLLKKGADINKPIARGPEKDRTPLYLAAVSRKHEAVKLILKFPEINVNQIINYENKETIVHNVLAMESLNKENMKEIIQRSKDINIKSEISGSPFGTPLENACYFPNVLAVELLLSDPRTTQINLSQAMNACLSIKKLEKEKAELNEIFKLIISHSLFNHMTCLTFFPRMVEHRFSDFISIYKEKSEQWFYSACVALVMRSNDWTDSKLLDAIKYLLSFPNVKVDGSSCEGFTMLAGAVYGKRLPIVKYLVDVGANIYQTDFEKLTNDQNIIYYFKQIKDQRKTQNPLSLSGQTKINEVKVEGDNTFFTKKNGAPRQQEQLSTQQTIPHSQSSHTLLPSKQATPPAKSSQESAYPWPSVSAHNYSRLKK